MEDYNKMTKGELAEQNLELQKQLDTAEEEKAAASADMQARIERMEALLEGKADDESVTDPELFYDPYDSPHTILKHPEGKRLSWKNPNYRQQRGWRGWVPVTHDDEIGSKLKEYIVDPPSQMSNLEHQDNYVRRGTDSILAWLPEDLWLHRQEMREAKALNKQVAANVVHGITPGQGVSVTGEGAAVTPPSGQKGQSLLRPKE